jgi:flagellar hook protein FlgE
MTVDECILSNVMTTAADSIVSLLLEELSQSLRPKIMSALADHDLYKETHAAVLKIPFVQRLLENQCRCLTKQQEPIQLEIIDTEVEHECGLKNLDSMSEYMNSTKLDANVRAAEFEYDTEEEDEEEVDDDDEKEVESKLDEEEEQDEEAQSDEDEPDYEEKEKIVSSFQCSPAMASCDGMYPTPNAANVLASSIQPTMATATATATVDEEPVEEEAQEEEEEELELFEVEIKGKTYVTNDETNGDIYEYVNNEVGEIVGAFKNGVAKLAKKQKSKTSQ